MYKKSQKIDTLTSGLIYNTLIRVAESQRIGCAKIRCKTSRLSYSKMGYKIKCTLFGKVIWRALKRLAQIHQN